MFFILFLLVLEVDIYMPNAYLGGIFSPFHYNLRKVIFDYISC